MTTNNSTDYFQLMCSAAKDIATTPGVYVLLILEIILGILASIPNFFLMFTIGRVTVFHNNLRLCLAHLSFCLLWYSFGYVIKAILLLATMLNGDACSLVTNLYECKLREIPLGIPAQTVVYAGLAVSLERLYSTLIYKRYDKLSERKPFLGITLILLAYVIPVANTLNNLIAISPTTELSLPICENVLSSTAKSATTSIVINMIAMALCIFAAAAVWRMNEMKLRRMMANRARHTLTARFQIEQNVQVNKIIVPSTVFQMICFIPNYIFLALVLVGLPLRQETKLILIHCNYVWKDCYAILHPVICFVRHERIRDEFQKCLPFQNFVKRVSVWKKDVTPGSREEIIEGGVKSRMEAHFQMLADAWNINAKAKYISSRV